MWSFWWKSQNHSQTTASSWCRLNRRCNVVKAVKLFRFAENSCFHSFWSIHCIRLRLMTSVMHNINNKVKSTNCNDISSKTMTDWTSIHHNNSMKKQSYRHTLTSWQSIITKIIFYGVLISWTFSLSNKDLASKFS